MGIGSEGPSKDIIGSALRDTQTKHCGTEVILYNYDLSQHRRVDVVEVVLLGVVDFPPTRQRPHVVRARRPVRTRFRIIARVATSTVTNLASLKGQPGLAHLLWDLAQAGLTSLGKCLHALPTTTILGIKLLIVLIRPSIHLLHPWLVFRVFASADKIFDGAAFAPAGLAALVADFSSALGHRHHADAGFLATLGVFALATAVFEAFLLLSIGVSVIALGA